MIASLVLKAFSVLLVLQNQLFVLQVIIVLQLQEFKMENNALLVVTNLIQVLISVFLVILVNTVVNLDSMMLKVIVHKVIIAQDPQKLLLLPLFL